MAALRSFAPVCLLAAASLAGCAAVDAKEPTGETAAAAKLPEADPTPWDGPVVYFHGLQGLYGWNRPNVIAPRYSGTSFLPAVSEAMRRLGETSSNILVIGFSYGRNPAGELAKRLGARVSRVVVLDPCDDNAAANVSAWGGETLVMCGHATSMSDCDAYPGVRCRYPLDHYEMFELIDRAAAWSGAGCPAFGGLAPEGEGQGAKQVSGSSASEGQSVTETVSAASGRSAGGADESDHADLDY